MKTIADNEVIIKIGQNASENCSLLTSSNPDDLFFHLSSFPSCFVILETKDTDLEQTLIYCATLCKEHTKFKFIPNISVDYCKCSNVKLIGTRGEIEYISNRQVKKLQV